VLNCVAPPFPGADADGFLDGRHEDLSVADTSRMSRLLNGLDRAFDEVVVDHQFDFDLGQEVHNVFSAAVKFGVALLPSEALSFGDGDALQADFVAEVSGETEDENTRRRRRRRRRRGRRDESGNLVSADGEGETEAEAEAEAEGESLGQGAVEGAEADDAEDEGEDEDVTLDNEGNPIAVADGEPAARRRRRGKRGGRRRNRGRDGLILSVGEDGGVAASEGDTEESEASSDVPVEVSFVPAADLPPVEDVATVVETVDAVPSEDAPKPKRTRAPRKKAVVAAEADAVPSAETAEPPKPKRPRAPRKKAVVVDEAAPAVETTAETTAETTPAHSENVVVDATLQDAASITPPLQDRGETMDSVVVELPVQVETTSEPAVVTAEPHPEQNEPAAPPRRGWWNRLL